MNLSTVKRSEILSVHAAGVDTMTAREQRRVQVLAQELAGDLKLWERLSAELRLAGICTIEHANAFLPAYLARYHASFSVPPHSPEAGCVPLDPSADLDRLFCLKSTRKVAPDNILHFAGQVLQLQPGPHRLSYARWWSRSSSAWTAAWSPAAPVAQALAPLGSRPHIRQTSSVGCSRSTGRSLQTPVGHHRSAV
jgi:hypothetical protein